MNFWRREESRTHQRAAKNKLWKKAFYRPFIRANAVNLKHLKSRTVFWRLDGLQSPPGSISMIYKAASVRGLQENNKMIVLHILKLEEGLESS